MHNNNLRPVAGQLRTRFGVLNAGLAETIRGIEVVKGFAQEAAEERRFGANADAYSESFVRERPPRMISRHRSLVSPCSPAVPGEHGETGGHTGMS